MASLIKRGKFWYVKYRLANSEQKWVKGYTDKGSTKELADRLENEKTAVKRGDFDPQMEAKRAERKREAAEHIEDYELHLDAKGCNPNHVSYTVSDIKAFFAFSNLKFAAEVRRHHVDRWVVSLKGDGENGDAARTVNRRVGSLQSFLRHLSQSGAVSEYVLFKYPKQRVTGSARRKRRALAITETTALLSCAKVPEGRKQIYRFTLLTGFRFNEVAGLLPSAVHFNHRTITVKSKDPKHTDRTHTVPLHRDLVEILKPLCTGDTAVFGKDMPRREDAAKILRRDCTAANVDTTHVDFHCLRHTFITRLAEAMVHPKILQQLARHASVETTLKYYTHFKQEDERRAIDDIAV